jgi:preprotein translocase subunit SecA
MNVLGALRRTIDQGIMASWRGMVFRIERQSDELKKLTNPELRKRSLALRYEVLSGRPLDQVVVEGAGLVREAAERSIGLRHYPVQILGGIAMHFGSIVVMQTGEGKTLTATIPMYLAALGGWGAHLATANDYLAARDAELMRPVYDLLGLSVGIVQSSSSRGERQAGYAADLTYSTAKEIGFDFLRDRILERNAEIDGHQFTRRLIQARAEDGSVTVVQRSPNFILVDEADSILIDEARTPLIVSSDPDEITINQTVLYRWSAEAAPQMQKDEHFEVDPQDKQIHLTQSGRQFIRKLPKPKALDRTPVLDMYEHVEQAIYVNRNFFRDRQYIINAGEIVIVDEFTGRLADGRKWRAGLHQAIEAREQIEISIPTGEAARITIQDLFLRYRRLAGMTGTAANSAHELRQIYRVKVIDVPTNRPPRRVGWPDLVFGTEEAKWLAIADEVEMLHRSGRPVLIGTRSIDKSERLSRILTDRGIRHDLLNARQLESEAAIIAEAGQVSRVTVATNVAGRGTDIKISGAAHDLGGLHVICSELHESARIDRQLIGRCGRQGDPGTYRQFMSLDDEILGQGLGIKRHAKLKQLAQQSPAQLARLATLFRRAQVKIERRHFSARKLLLHQEKLRQELQRELGKDPYQDTAGA